MARATAFALAVASLGLVAAGCGSGGHPASTAAAARAGSSSPCTLSAAQRRGKVRALADIRRLRRLEASLQRSSERGAPHQEQLTGKFLLDLLRNLPLYQFSRLLHQAKAAVRLCGDCSTGLETEEPVLGNRGLRRARCG